MVNFDKPSPQLLNFMSTVAISKQIAKSLLVADEVVHKD